MNKKVLLGVGAGVVIAIAALLAIPKDTSQEATTNENANATNTASQSQFEQTSLKALLTNTASRTCTYKVAGESASTGTVYTANGKMRGDFSFTATNQNYLTHMIVDGQTSYVWMDGQSTGFKTDFTAMQQNPTKGAVSNTGQTNVDPNQNYDFECRAGSIDPDKFALPTTVQFNDLASLEAQSTPAGTTSPAEMEALCNKLPEPNKTQCKASLPKN